MTFSGVTAAARNANRISIAGGPTALTVTGNSSTFNPDVDNNSATIDGGHQPVLVDVTATDTGGQAITTNGVLSVTVDQAPVLSTTPTMRDVTFSLSELASNPTRFVLVQGHFRDIDSPIDATLVATASRGDNADPLVYAASSSNSRVATVTVVCATLSAGALSTPTAYAPGPGVGCDTSTTAVAALQITPIRAGTAVITVTATENDADGTAATANGLGQSISDTITITVSPT